ncbi:MAG TPA: LysR family transcriptional regulator [Candidatus Ventrimonas merdavium]|nr:LysR family transcriptional regulator [Candidatus Ventrimonas merdavium]
MTTRQLYYLVTIAELGNLSKAAQSLEVSQPALSKFLGEYENAMGFHLFLRYRRQLIPTAVGRYILSCAQKILDEQTRMQQSLRALTDTNHSVIRLATAPNRGAIIYSRIYNQFSKRYPDVSLSLTELYASEQPGAILRGQVDLALGSGKTSDKVADLPFAYEELLVSLPVSHPLSSQERIRLSDLKDTPFVLQGPNHSIRILAEELFQEAGFSPVVTFESNDVILVDSMLHQAVGVGLVSQAHVFPCDELVYRPLDPPVHQTLHIRYPLGHTLTEPEQYLAGLLIRERLSDPRYRSNPLPEAESLMQVVSSDSEDGRIADSAVFSHTARTAPASLRATPQLNLNTALLRYIIAIVDEKSLTKAAEKFYLTQPALSRHLRNVEEMAGTRLFTRVHNRLQPTNAGKVFVNFARNMLQIDMEMKEYIRAYQKGRGGGIYLQCDEWLPDEALQSAAAAFQELHPDIQLHLEKTRQQEVTEALLNASADYGLYCSCQEKHPILNSHVIAKSELVYCFGPGVPPLRPIPLADPAEQLAGRPLMLCRKESSLRLEQDRILDLLQKGTPRIVCEASIPILQRLAVSGAADTILPLDLIPPEARSRCVSFDRPQFYCLLEGSHPGRLLPPSVSDLAGLLEEHLKNCFSGQDMGSAEWEDG